MVPAPATTTRASRARWDAIVIGTGVGGSVTAALLAHTGLRVLVLEKNHRVGGILAGYEKQGFHLDHGSHLVAQGDRGTLGVVLRELGLSEPRFITHPIPVRSRGMFSIRAPRRRMGLLWSAVEAAVKLRLPVRDALALLRMLVRTFRMSEAELARLDRTSLDEFILCHTAHPGAWFLFAFLASIFYVLPPWRVSAGESLRGLRGVLTNYRLSYVQGGMDKVPHALLGVVNRAGGEVVVGAAATGIERAHGGLRVVTAGGDTYDAPVVAANLAPSDLLGLLRTDDLPSEWMERARAIEPSGNAHQLKIGLSRRLVDEGCLIGGISRTGLTLADLSMDLMRRTVDDIAAGRVSDPLAVYAPVPTNYDPSLAPPGGQLIVASFYGPTVEAPADGPRAWRDAMVDALRRVIPGFDDALLFVDFASIPALGKWMGKSSRAAICNGQTPGQVGADRLPVATPVPGLFLCGDGAGGRGIGMELAASSAREAASAALGRTG